MSAPLSPGSATTAERRARFAELHRGPGCFVIPNPWDVGSTVYLTSLGFKALATTSAGMAFAAGRPDNGVTRDYALKHIAELVAASPLPFNADFEAGFGSTPDEVFQSARLCIETGVAGFSIEDYTGLSDAPFYPLHEAVERLRAARRAIDSSGEKVLLTARSETIWAGHPDGLKEALRRLAAFAAAGADVLFAPGLKRPEEVEEVVRAAAGLPVNVVVGAPGFSLRQLEDLGVRRVSTGAGLARAAWGGFLRAAKLIAAEGRFDGFADAAPAAELNALFAGRPD
jgi:2-methylisocitrate lyase-like PEP mutase family enzyme